MKWTDVSLTLSENLPCWPSDDPFLYQETRTIASGNHSNCASFSMSAHFGTHIDAPYHFITKGKTVDEISPDLLIGPCLVVSAEETKDYIEPKHLKNKVPEGTKRLLVKSRNSNFLLDGRFHTDFTGFSEQCAEWIVSRGVKLIGLDYYSVGPYENLEPPHKVFLGSECVIIENVNLTSIEPGEYEIICMPLKIKGSGGAPARVMLGQKQQPG